MRSRGKERDPQAHHGNMRWRVAGNVSKLGRLSSQHIYVEHGSRFPLAALQRVRIVPLRKSRRWNIWQILTVGVSILHSFRFKIGICCIKGIFEEKSKQRTKMFQFTYVSPV